MVLPEALMLYLRRFIDRFRGFVGGLQVSFKALEGPPQRLNPGIGLLLISAFHCTQSVVGKRHQKAKIAFNIFHSVILPVASLRRSKLAFQPVTPAPHSLHFLGQIIGCVALVHHGYGKVAVQVAQEWKNFQNFITRQFHSAILPVASLRRNGPLVPTLHRRPKKEGVLCLCPQFLA